MMDNMCKHCPRKNIGIPAVECKGTPEEMKKCIEYTRIETLRKRNSVEVMSEDKVNESKCPNCGKELDTIKRSDVSFGEYDIDIYIDVCDCGYRSNVYEK